MQYSSYLQELVSSFKSPQLWIYMGWNDVRSRYRRSLLGPLWLVINTAIFISMLGVLWSTLFKTDLKEYMPYFCTGYIFWQFILAQLNESAAGFSQFEYIIKQIRLPFRVYILRLLVRNFINFLHNFIVLIVVLLIFQDFKIDFLSVFSFVLGFALFLIALFGASILISLLCTKYRDMTMVFQNLLMIIFYFTPILWLPKNLPSEYKWLADINPIYIFIEIVRAPILGEVIDFNNIKSALFLTFILFFLSFFAMSKKRNCIAYWI